MLLPSLMPSSMKDKFVRTYEGYPTAVFTTSIEYNNFTLALKELGASFRTKINKNKKRGREFFVMLVAPSESTNGN